MGKDENKLLDASSKDAREERTRREDAEARAMDIICSQCFAVNCNRCRLSQFLNLREEIYGNE